MFDDAEELKGKVRQLAVAVKQANHLVVYTGAGISTVCTKLSCAFSVSFSSPSTAVLMILFLSGSFYPRLQGS